MTVRGCEIAECDARHYGKGKCKKHYMRDYARKYYNQWYPLDRPECSASRCDRKSFRRGLCPSHSRIERLYGITIEDYEELLVRQDGQCPVCGEEPERFEVDHDHNCCKGKAQSCGNCVRGLLCGMCNRGLGHFKDDPLYLERAIEYLAEHKAVA